jgi:hypothetical protein
MIINRDEVVDYSGEIPQGSYAATLTEVKAELSKKKEEMHVLTWELVAPDVVEHNGKQTQVAGREITMYVSWSKKAQKSSLETMDSLFGEPLPKQVDTTQLTVALAELKGHAAIVEVEPEPYFKTDTGKRDGKVQTDANGQPIIAGYRHSIKSVQTQLMPLQDIVNAMQS